MSPLHDIGAGKWTLVLILVALVSCVQRNDDQSAQLKNAQMEVEKAKAEAELARSQAEAAKAQAEAAKAEAEAAKAEAEAAKMRAETPAPQTGPEARAERQQAATAADHQETPQGSADPVELFRALMSRTYALLHGHVAVQFSPRRRGWSRFRVTLSDVGFDVQRTDSLVSPYRGVLSFNVYFAHHVGGSFSFSSKADAESAQDAFGAPSAGSAMRVYYAYSNGTWVYQSSEVKHNVIPGDPWGPPSGFLVDPVESLIKTASD